jgi:hypothetical protein
MISEAGYKRFLMAVWQGQQQMGTADGWALAEREFSVPEVRLQSLTNISRQCEQRGWLWHSTDFRELRLTEAGMVFIGK